MCLFAVASRVCLNPLQGLAKLTCAHHSTRSIKEVNLDQSELQREGFRSKHWSTMRVLRPTAPKIDPSLTDEAISGMTIGEMKALIEP